MRIAYNSWLLYTKELVMDHPELKNVREKESKYPPGYCVDDDDSAIRTNFFWRRFEILIVLGAILLYLWHCY
jgi:hypothetical protein